MVTLSAIVPYIDRLLDSEKIPDAAVNGLQVRGQEEITHLVTGVSVCLPLFQAAADAGAQAILVHHGLLWNKESRVVEGNAKRRLGALLDRDLTLLAYHLPLDCHPVLGNNARIIQELGWQFGKRFGRYQGLDLSWLAVPPAPTPVAPLVHLIGTLFATEPTWLPFGPEVVRSLAVCSGGAPELVAEAVRSGADLFLTGELSEPVYHLAQEEKIHVVAAGHHRTERLGVRALGDHLAQAFGIAHTFIDIPNPL